MKNDGIEDILIGERVDTTRKKGKKIIIILLIILLLILIAIITLYKKYTTQTVSQKEAFVKNMSSVNIERMLQTNIYKELYTKILKEDYETNNSVSYTTNVKNENFGDLDFSKFMLDIYTSNDNKNSKSYGEFNLTYSGNSVFELKSLSDENAIGIFSDEISDKYIAVNYEKIKDVFNLDFDFNKIHNLKNMQQIDIEDSEKEEYLKKYLETITNNLTENQFSVQDNVAIQKDSETINVTSRTLTLSQTELNDLIIKLLEQLKNDDELLEKIISTKNNNTKIINEDELNENIINEDSINNENLSDENDVIDENIDEQGETEQLEENVEQIDEENPIDEDNLEQQNEDMSIDENNQESILDNIINLLLGNKINKTLEEVKEDIDTIINKVQEYEGKGLVITVYASKDKTEKIAMTLPNENTIDLELLLNTDTENNFKLTYLYKGNNNILKTINKNEILTYSAGDQIESSDDIDQSKTNGFSLEVNKTEREAKTSINAIYSFIEDEQINKKISFKIDTDGTSNSNNFKNNIIITQSTNEGESTLTFDNDINFGTTKEIEQLPQDSIFLDMLTPEELEQTKDTILDRIKTVYNEKQENFNFLDTNVHASVIDKASSNVTKDEAREALYNKVSVMMGEAINRNEEFTIQNLVDLKIDGYEVSSTVTETEAIIVVDIYTFKIDTEFNLTDVE